MPIRMLRDWTDSEPVNQLDDGAEVLFVRLIMKADDYGRFTANPKLIRALCFPLRDGIRESDIARRIAECETAGLIATYSDNGKPLLQIVNFGQRMRNGMKAKYPPPPDSAASRGVPPQVAAERGNPPPEWNGIELESEKKRTGEFFDEIDNSGTPKGDTLTFRTPLETWAKKIWDKYPKKAQKGLLSTSLDAAVIAVVADKGCTDELAFAWILAAVMEFAASPMGKKSPPEKLPSPARWLDDQRWNDDRTLWRIPIGAKPQDANKPKFAPLPKTDLGNDLMELMK